MAWTTLTSDDVQRQLSAPELNALTTAAKALSQTSDTILAEAITDTIYKIRGYVAANTRNALGDGETIPNELKATALTLIRNYLFNRLPGMKALNDEPRQKETDRAISELKDVAAGRFLIVAPETEAPQQAGGPGIAVAKTRQDLGSRRQMDGI